MARRLSVRWVAASVALALTNDRDRCTSAAPLEAPPPRPPWWLLVGHCPREMGRGCPLVQTRLIGKQCRYSVPSLTSCSWMRPVVSHMVPQGGPSPIELAAVRLSRPSVASSSWFMRLGGSPSGRGWVPPAGALLKLGLYCVGMDGLGVMYSRCWGLGDWLATEPRSGGRCSPRAADIASEGVRWRGGERVLEREPRGGPRGPRGGNLRATSCPGRRRDTPRSVGRPDGTPTASQR